MSETRFGSRRADLQVARFSLVGILIISWSATTYAETLPVSTARKSSEPVTFNQHIAAIVHGKCAMCHRPGQAGPFSLLTYDDVRNRAETIDAVIDSGYMPPWKPVNDHPKFANDRRLTTDEKSKLKAWIVSGMPVGTQPSPTPPEFPDGWTLGEPDLVVTMNGQFNVPASGPDVYRSFVFPLQLPEDKWVKAVELRPKAKSSMHHALFLIDRNGNTRRMEGRDGRPGIDGMEFLTAILAPPVAARNPESDDLAMQGQGLRSRLTSFQAIGSFASARPEFLSILGDGLGVYVPGTVPVPKPEGLAMFLPKGSDVIMQTHFHPSGKPETEQAKLALYFADQPPAHRIVPIQVPPMFGFGYKIKIPAGEKKYLVTESFELPIDVRAVSVFPHGHYICRTASLRAELPDGTIETLIEIDDWDLDWQDSYQFAEPIELPAGTVVRSELTYDNSADNPENPNHPPREIRWGLQSGDEMGSVGLGVVAMDESERPQLESALRKHFVSAVLDPEKIVDLLMQLDLDRDGRLQPSEAPPGLDQIVSLLDGNKNQALDRAELGILKEFVKALRPKQN